ncbi:MULTISPECIES: helix-turn-helix domain-containing protein [unclassified Streptomyces]|uniref:helix-turn-helix domain-containing protein n=1 Tax=unclassified Streptomyces TaxID=2593676 RepID=UPI002E31D881|nr:MULTISPECIES: helix-turn-helix domain-containing protein [unclassified Streptomyces]WUC66025.1 helix-turn-helix domain-containing protein [Streptomyces sp. NBC_00539]
MAFTQSSALPRAAARLTPRNHRSGVIHVKSRHRKRFTVVGNHLAQHARLSATAIGVALYIQSLPDGASVNIKALAAHFPEGQIRMAAALRELEQFGYVERRVVRLDNGRMVTRTYYYEQPGAEAEDPAETRPGRVRPAPVPEPEPVPEAAGEAVEPDREVEEPEPEPEEPDREAEEAEAGTGGPGAAPVALHPATFDLLAGLRGLDPRLLLSERDVLRLAPGLSAWLARGIAPDVIARKLSADLPEPLRNPAGILGYRLTAMLPPPLPAALPVVPVTRPDPFQTCDGCERVFRSKEPGRCRDCSPGEPANASAA